MVYTMLKSTYTKLEPKILRNRSYKDLQHGLKSNGMFSDFNDDFKQILNHHAPIKQSKLRGNTKPYTNKILREEIVKKSRLRNKANISGKEEDKRFSKLYIQQNKVMGTLAVKGLIVWWQTLSNFRLCFSGQP